MACFISSNGLIFLSRVGATRSLAKRGLSVSTRRMYGDLRRLRGPVSSRSGGDCLRVSNQLPVASKKFTWIARRQLWSCTMTGSAGWVNYSMLRSPLSYWSVSADNTGGVSFLLDPRQAASVRPWPPELWTNRVICVEIDDVLLVNI